MIEKKNRRHGSRRYSKNKTGKKEEPNEYKLRKSPEVPCSIYRSPQYSN